MQRLSSLLIQISFSALMFFFSGMVFADLPSRVFRLGYLDGIVSFAPAGEDQWVLAKRNRPIVTGDKLWSDSGSHAELQLGSAVIRLYDQTSINILNLDDNIAQLELDQGT